MPAQRNSMSACPASGQKSHTTTEPSPATRHLSLVSTPHTPTPDGQPTTQPADPGHAPDPDLELTPATAPCSGSAETLCVQLEELRTALVSSGHVDDQVLDVLTGVIAGLSIVGKTHLKVVD